MVEPPQTALSSSGCGVTISNCDLDVVSTAGDVLSFSEVETPAAKTPYMVAAKGAEGIAWLFNLENIALWEDVSTNDVTVGNATEPAHAPERDSETAQVFEGFLW